MFPRLLFRIFIGGIFCGSTLAAADSAPEADSFAILNTDPPGVLVVNARTFAPVGSVALPAKPGFATLVPGGFLYVFQNAGPCIAAPNVPVERNAPSTLSVVDLHGLRVIRTIPLGWNTLNFALSENGQRLITFGIGRPGHNNPKQEEAAVHVIDTRSHEVLSRYGMGAFAQEMLVTPDFKRAVVLRARETGNMWIWSKRILAFEPDVATCLDAVKKYPREGSYEVAILDPELPKPVREFPVPGNPTGIVMPPAGLWAYLVDAGWPDHNPKNFRGGQIHAVNVTDGALAATHPIGAFPRWTTVDQRTNTVLNLSHKSVGDHTGQIYRLQGQELAGHFDTTADPLILERYSGLDEQVLFAKKEICLTNDQGKIDPPCLPFSWTRALGTKEEEWQDLPAMQAQYVPARRELLLHAGEKDQRLAILNLNERVLARVVPIGRQDVKSSKDAGVFFTNLLLFALSAAGNRPAQGYIAPMPRFWTGFQAWPGDTVVVPADGRYAYVRNYYTDDVTAVNLESRTAEKYFPVGGGGGGLLLSGDGSRLWTFSKKQITLIDTVSNQIAWQPETRGDIRQVSPPDERGKVVAMTDKELLVLDPQGHKITGKVEGLAKPQMFLSIGPRAPEPPTAGQ